MNSFHISVSERNEAIDDYSSLRMLTLDTIAKLTFGGNLHFVDKGDPNHEIIRFINAVVCHNSTADTRSVPGHHDRYPPHSKCEEIKARFRRSLQSIGRLVCTKRFQCPRRQRRYEIF